MKIPILLTAAALLLPLMSFSLAPSSTTAATTATPPADPELFTGKITCWAIHEDGTVKLRLRLKDGKHFWFATPGNQSSTTQFELLVLNAVLELTSRDNQTVTLRGEGNLQDDGDDRESALRLVTIGCE